MAYSHHLPHHRTKSDPLTPSIRLELRKWLSANLTETERPIALHHEAAYVSLSLRPLGGMNFIFREEDTTQRAALHQVHRDLQVPLGLLGSRMLNAKDLLREMSDILHTEQMRSDQFMLEEVTFDVFHFPRGAVVAWKMDRTRLRKLCRNRVEAAGNSANCRNNPAGALGTAITIAPQSNHDEIAEAGVISDIVERYRIVSATHLRQADVSILPPLAA